eukprot:ctg_6720.g618
MFVQVLAASGKVRGNAARRLGSVCGGFTAAGAALAGRNARAAAGRWPRMAPRGIGTDSSECGAAGCAHDRDAGGRERRRAGSDLIWGRGGRLWDPGVERDLAIDAFCWRGHGR